MTLVDQLNKIVGDDSHLNQLVGRYTSLVVLVDQEYRHIDQLELLIQLLESGLSTYYKEYHPKQDEIVVLFGKIAENTRANHYRRDEKLEDIYDIANAFRPKYGFVPRDEYKKSGNKPTK